MPTASDKFLFVKTAGALRLECEDALLHRPDINHDVLQILADISRKSEFLSPPYCFFSVIRGSRTLGCGVNLQPDGLVLSDLPMDTGPLIIEAIKYKRIGVRRLVGPPQLVSGIAQDLCEQRNYQILDTVEWTVGRLDKPISGGKRVCGSIRRASPRDFKLIETWAKEYSKEKPTFLDIPRFMRLKMKSGDLFLWDDRGPRSLATVSGTTERGVRISSVFTPVAFRGRGYASGIVERLGNKLLRSGFEFVVLTWRTGADEERLYRRLGFVSAGMRRALMFERNERLAKAIRV